MPFSTVVQKSAGKCQWSINFLSFAHDAVQCSAKSSNPHIMTCHNSSVSQLHMQHGLSPPYYDMPQFLCFTVAYATRLVASALLLMLDAGVPHVVCTFCDSCLLPFGKSLERGSVADPVNALEVLCIPMLLLHKAIYKVSI
jgi:hypothetical protein